MAVTVREVLDDALVATAEPQVEVAGDSLDNPVRWVFTNEREDVASFLAGGELLVVEGRSLVADGREKRADEYVKSLVNADIAALMVELVEEVTQLPKMLVKAAKHEGLTIIGLRRRIPFVDICQSVNTMIVRDQMRMQMQVDVMSTSLRSELAQASNPKAVADGIANLFRRGCGHIRRGRSWKSPEPDRTSIPLQIAALYLHWRNRNGLWALWRSASAIRCSMKRCAEGSNRLPLRF